MKNKTKMLSIVLAIVMILTSVSIGVPTFAASKPSATQITSIKAVDNGFKVKWKKKSVTGYQVQYSTSKKFTSKTSKTLKVNKAKTTSKTVKKLKAKKKYYVRVRTYKTVKKKNYYSKWSANYSVTTKAKKGSSSSSSSVPTIKSISYLDKGYGFKLTWSKVSKAYGYEIQYSTDKKFSDVYDDEGYVFDNMHKDVSKGSTSVNFKVGDKDPAADNTWYVRVRAEKSGGKYSGWSKTVSILTPERKDYLRLMDKAYGEMGITAQMTDIQKLAAIQNWIGNNWYYDADTEHEDAVGKYQIAKYHHNGCNSFANAFNYFANKAGIESYTIGGMRKKLSGGHYWNFICIQGKWFNYDCESGNGIGGFYPETRATEYYELDLESKKIYESKQPLGTHDEYISMNEQFKLLYPKCVNTIYK
mgnify:CR=1 FL=1